MRGSRTAALLVGAVAASSLAACSSSGGGGSVSGDLGTALGMIPDTANTRTYVEFGRLEAQYEATGGKVTSQPYGRLTGYGLGTVASYSYILKSVLGFDTTHGQWAVIAGQPPHSGGLIVGASTGGLAAKAKPLSTSVSTAGSATTYRFAPDLRLDASSKLAKAFGPGGFAPFNLLRLDGDDLRYSRAAADLDLTDAHSATLADNAQVTAVAGCLGTPLAAVITNRLESARSRLPAAAQASAPKPTVGLAYVGVSTEGTKGGTPHEHLCVEAGSDKQASTIGDSVRTAFASGTSLVTNRKWSTMFKDPKVTVSGSLVSVDATPADGTAAHFLTGIQSGDLPGLSG